MGDIPVAAPPAMGATDGLPPVWGEDWAVEVVGVAGGSGGVGGLQPRATAVKRQATTIFMPIRIALLRNQSGMRMNLD